MFKKTIICFLVAAAIIDVAFACNGYKVKLLKLENCAGADAIITVDPDFTIKLNKKCELVPTGCIANKAFTTAVAKYKLQKDGIVLKEGKLDLCATADQASAEAKDWMKLFGAPASCPIAEEKICANDHKVDLSKYKSMLGMAKGSMILDTDIKHDTGKSCFHMEMEISKS